ncbi:hypothetical protein [Planktomarina sp.]|uniref:hypothetical protein n=1 Tax=Planktomarina sp. TaxID=2024851 RepID=UPI003260EAF5|tara:strand:+ start:637 stop:1800 length:1164 start_codon:yes stop_codon:yes gene_type:complete
MAEDNVMKSMTLLPEYQEKFLKDLLANVYQVDEESGTISGIAARSPLESQQYFQTEDGGSTLDPTQAAVDEAGNPIKLYQATAGGFTSDPTLAAMDQYDQPIFAMESGVGVPDVIGFTDAQTDALDRLMGAVDEDGNVIYEGMMESYQPYLDEALETFQTGVDTVDASTAEYDPTSYKDFYDPFVEEVIDAQKLDVQEALERERSRLGSEAASYGAFGRRRDLMEGDAAGRAAVEEAKLGSQLRSAAFTGAQQQAQSAFENQQKRGLQAGQLFQGLGTGIGALGESAQSQGFQDFNTLFNAGQLEQQQLQRQYDVQRAADLEQAYEPFARFSYMRDILQGVPSSGTSLAAAATPQASPLGATLNYAGQLGGATGGIGTLGSIVNRGT